MEFFLFLTLICGPLVLIDFAVFLFGGRHFLSYGFRTGIEIYVLGFMPLLFLTVVDFGKVNDCCKETALFSPHHRLGIYLLIVLCLTAFGYSKLRIALAPPLLELVVNVLLVVGIVLNVFIAIQVDDLGLLLLGNAPIIILFLYRLIDNHRSILQATEADTEAGKATPNFYSFLYWALWKRAPVLLLLAVPFLVLLACLLMLFGQKPDALVLAFTETYRQGLSELDCSNVTCPDGHFLCTIAANGHKRLVKPLRKGVRQEVAIKVNRQLLVSNAFEDLISERMPVLHRCIRTAYNIIGGNCKRLYDALGNKWIADVVYVFMKPLEWLFLTSLYLLDRNPENRIAKQYLYNHHRRAIDEMTLN